MPARKQPNQPPNKQNPKSPKAAEQKFGKAARKAAETGGKKPKIWQRAESIRPLPGAMPLPGESGGLESVVSRTIEAPASEVYRAFNDPTRRSWCHAAGYGVRRSTAPRSLMLGLPERADGALGGIVHVLIERKGNSRSQVTVRESGLASAGDVDRARADWRRSLDHMAGMLDE